jgi:putative ABC transport system permease protein
MFRQVRYAFRHLSRARGFSLLAISTLALAGGGTGALLSLLNALVLRPLDAPEADRLAVVTVSSDAGLQGFISLPAFKELQGAQDAFERLCGTTGGTTARAEFQGIIVTVTRESVTGDCHLVLGARPHLGRLLTESDFANAEPVVLVSYGLWQRQLGGDPGIVGKSLRVEGVPLNIVGVTAPTSASSIGLDQTPDLVVPLSLMQRLLNTPAALRAYYLVGRLKGGVSIDAAQARLRTLWPEILKTAVNGPDPLARQYMRGLNQLRVESGSHGISPLRKRYARPLQLLLGLGLLVLVVACCNVGGLLLARVLGREAELGMHVALGSTHALMSRQLLVEGILLGLASAAAAVPLAYWFAQSLAAMLWIGTTALTLSLVPDARVIGAMLVGGVLCGSLVSLPSLALWRLRPVTLGAAARSVVRGTAWLGKSLVVGQFALTLALMSSAVVFMRNLAEARLIDPGYRTSELLFMRPSPVPGPPPRIDMASHNKTLIERLRALGGVQGVALSNQFPLVTKDSVPLAPMRTVDSAGRAVEVEALPDFVSPEFFDVAGVRLLRGRSFTWDDTPVHPQVAIVNASLAAKLFGTADPIGKQLSIVAGTKTAPAEVIGVVADASPGDVRISELPMVYRPILQEPGMLRNPVITMRAQESEGLREAAIRAVSSLGHSYVMAVRSIEEQIDRTLLTERVLFVLSIFVGALSLVLAALGLHGLFAYSVKQRSRELGLRLALGASGQSVTRMVLAEGAALAVGGMLLGVPLTLASGRLSRALLSEIPTPSYAAIVSCSAALLVVGIVGVAVPARRAARTDAATALRAD